MNSAKTFSTPRNFDLSTMLVVTTAYASVFAFLQAINTPAIVAVIIAVFFTSVALGQAILFGAKHPRWASVVVGSSFVAILLTVELTIGRHGLPVGELLVISVLYLISGAFLGYLGGAIVGFVFMVAHGVRLILSPSDSSLEPSDD